MVFRNLFPQDRYIGSSRKDARKNSFFSLPPTPIQTPVILFPKCVCTFKEAVYILVFERGKQNRGDLWICWRRKKLLLSKLMDSENSLCICLTKPRFIQSHQRVIWTSLNLISWRMHFSRRYNSSDHVQVFENSSTQISHDPLCTFSFKCNNIWQEK